MLKGHNLIYFGPDTWDGLWRTRQQIVSMFATQNKVLFVEGRLHLRKTVAGFRQGELELADLGRPSLRRISENLHVFRYPLWAPISGRFPLDQFTRAIRRRSLKSALRKLHISQPIVWFHRPSMIDLIDEVPSPSLLLYHVVDEYTSYGGLTPASRRRIQEQEKEMMAVADAVIVVSEELYNAKSPFNPNTYLVPNGVDYQAYSTALADEHLPANLQNVPAPRLGYSGLIGDRLDLNTLTELASENPEWSLVFLGEVRFSQQKAAWQTLAAMPNVHYLGLVDISQVPHYLKGFDVGLMPYLQDQESENISPMKLYDYLAAGLPVASIDIPAIHQFGDQVHVANDPRDFISAVSAALADTTPERRQARREIAAQHSWEARMEQLSELIQAHLGARARR